MPGLSYLFKKQWHPLKLQNQKKVYEIEQYHINKLKKEEEARKEIEKERELLKYEINGDIKERDPRNTSLKFMYEQPKNKNKEIKEEIIEEIEENKKKITQYLGRFIYIYIL